MIAQDKSTHTFEVHIAHCCAVCKHYDSDMPGDYAGHCRERVYPSRILENVTVDVHVEVRNYNTCDLWARR